MSSSPHLQMLLMLFSQLVSIPTSLLLLDIYRFTHKQYFAIYCAFISLSPPSTFISPSVLRAPFLQRKPGEDRLRKT